MQYSPLPPLLEKHGGLVGEKDEKGRRHIGAPFSCTNWAAGYQQKHLEPFHFFYIKGAFFSLEN